MKIQQHIIYKLFVFGFFFMNLIDLQAQHPKIYSVERDSKDFLVTKLLLNNDNLRADFVRLNDEIEFKIQPSETKLYTYQLKVIVKKGIASIKILDQNNSIVNFIEVNKDKDLDEMITKELKANQTYRLILKGENFKGKINLIWK